MENAKEENIQKAQYCTHCGNTLAPNTRYCEKCGAPTDLLNNDTPSIENTQAPRKIIKWPFFLGGGITTFFIIVFVLLSIICFHEWEPATCSSYETCIKCGKTKGEMLEHTWIDATCTSPKTCSVCNTTEGKLSDHIPGEPTSSSDYVNGKTIIKTSCTVCGSVIEQDERKITKFHNGSNFIYNPVTFSQRYDAMLDEITGCPLSANCLTTDENVVCVISNQNDNTGIVMFMDGDSIFTQGQKYKTGFNTTMLAIYSSDSTDLAYILHAFVRTCDPEISFNDAKSICTDLLKEDHISKNGIKYVAVKDSGKWLVGATIE